MRSAALLVLSALLLAGCVEEPPAEPKDVFPDDPHAGETFAANATQGLFALHLSSPQDGRVAYRVLARDGAKVDACLIQGHDHELWWANRTVPVKACQRDAIIAMGGATLPAGAWSLVLRASSCPTEACNVTAVVVGADVTGRFQGPLDPARVEAIAAARCAIC